MCFVNSLLEKNILKTRPVPLRSLNKTKDTCCVCAPFILPGSVSIFFLEIVQETDDSDLLSFVRLLDVAF